MYVWKNANRRDRRRPRHPEAVSASKSAVPKDLREWRARCVAKAAAERDKAFCGVAKERIFLRFLGGVLV